MCILNWRFSALYLQDFEEMMQLAMKGDICGVDVCGIHMKKDAPDDPAARLYTSYPDRETAYHLGLATESDGKPTGGDLLSEGHSQAFMSIETDVTTDVVMGLRSSFKVTVLANRIFLSESRW